MVNGIFVGLSTVDVVYGVDEFPPANSKIVARSQEVFVGGPATNACVTFAHLGGKPALVSAVGRHSLAHVIKDELQRNTIRLIDLNPEFDELPVISSVAVNEAGERNVISANETRVHVSQTKVDEAVLQEASIVLVDGHFMQSCQAWAHAAHARGIHVVFDGGSWKDGTDELLKSIDSAICSADFLPPGCRTEDEVFAFLKNHGVTRIAITKGAEPIRFISERTSGVVRVPQGEVVDSMGAGDIFHGAFCYFVSSGCGIVEALVEATRIAAESCRFHGTREWMKHISAEPAHQAV